VEAKPDPIAKLRGCPENVIALDVRTYYYISCALIRLFLKVLWRYRRLGTEHVPMTGGVIIASNHAAYVDPPFLGAVTPRELFYLAKAELFSNALFGWLIKKYNAVPITRGAFDRKAINRAVELLKEGKALLLFPEGTRSREGGFLEPKLGVGRIALEAGVPIVPAYLHNTRRLRSCLLGKGRLVFAFGEPIGSDFLRKLPFDKTGYKKVVHEIMARIGMMKEKVQHDDF
jgi:1-acyl-sn-glycerol-3-phosphate acyltransferase